MTTKMIKKLLCVSPLHEVRDDMGFGNFGVSDLPHFRLSMKDGVHIGLRLRVPTAQKDLLDTQFEQLTKSSAYFSKPRVIHSGKQSTGADMTFPAILEMLPYCKDTKTLGRDHARHSRMASHGFVCVRADTRGTGTSEGICRDEYEAEEQQDCVHIIHWLASQPWCNGKVGLFGKSWGGNVGLQVAAHSPGPLQAVVSLYSTDDRFNDDIHYMGGCVIGNGMLPWASQMLLWNARPPLPKHMTLNYSSNNFHKNNAASSIKIKENWQRVWTERLKNTVPLTEQWLKNQSLNKYWAHGSVRSKTEDIQCPVLVFGGLTDAYTNAAFRLAASLNPESRVIMGPWSHDWPDTSIPGPNIDFIGICLEWFRHHLRSSDNFDSNIQPNGFYSPSKWPRLQLFVESPTEPSKRGTDLKGDWVLLSEWARSLQDYNSICQTTRSAENNAMLQLNLFEDLDLHEPDGTISTKTSIVSLMSHPMQGHGCGEWMTSGEPGELSGDQTLSNKESHVWISQPLKSDMYLAGFSSLIFRVKTESQGVFSLAARLCHYWPSGEISRISYGLRKFIVTEKGLEEGWTNLKTELKATAYQIPSGHRFGLAVSRSYFPLMLPTPGKGPIHIDPNNSTFIAQLLPQSLISGPRPSFKAARPLLQIPHEIITCGNYSLDDIEIDRNECEHQKNIMSNLGKTLYPMEAMTIAESSQVTYSVNNVTNAVAEVTARRHLDMEFRDEGIRTQIETLSTMRCGNDSFVLEDTLHVKLNDEDIFQKNWCSEVPRMYV